jgi:hypothetical protein
MEKKMLIISKLSYVLVGAIGGGIIGSLLKQKDKLEIKLEMYKENMASKIEKLENRVSDLEEYEKYKRQYPDAPTEYSVWKSLMATISFPDENFMIEKNEYTGEVFKSLLLPRHGVVTVCNHTIAYLIKEGSECVDKKNMEYQNIHGGVYLYEIEIYINNKFSRKLGWTTSFDLLEVLRKEVFEYYLRIQKEKGENVRRSNNSKKNK